METFLFYDKNNRDFHIRVQDQLSHPSNINAQLFVIYDRENIVYQI